MSLRADSWISSCVNLLICIGGTEQYLNPRSNPFPKAELIHWNRQNSEEEPAWRLLVGEEVLLREEWAGGPTLELQLLRHNCCPYCSESKTVLRQRRRPSTQHV